MGVIFTRAVICDKNTITQRVELQGTNNRYIYLLSIQVRAGLYVIERAEKSLEDALKWLRGGFSLFSRPEQFVPHSVIGDFRKNSPLTMPNTD